MLPTRFGSFGQAASEEKIQMWKVNRPRTTRDGKSSHGLSARWAKNIIKNRWTIHVNYFLNLYQYMNTIYMTPFVLISLVVSGNFFKYKS